MSNVYKNNVSYVPKRYNLYEKIDITFIFLNVNCLFQKKCKNYIKIAFDIYEKYRHKIHKVFLNINYVFENC